MMEILKEFSEKDGFGKIQQTIKKPSKLHRGGSKNLWNFSRNLKKNIRILVEPEHSNPI